MSPERPVGRRPDVPRRRRRVVILVVLLGTLLIGWDLQRAPSDQASAWVLLLGIDAYQRTLSPIVGAVGMQCRFEPTCSHYGRAVIERHGALHGSWLAARRLSRCGPWTPLGTVDPPL